MGKAVPQNIKSKANLLLQTYPNELSSDFEANKTFINSFEMLLSKQQRNLIAAYITRMKCVSKA